MASQNFRVVLAEPEDVSFLPDIDRSAGLLLKARSKELGLREDLFGRVNSVETFSKV